VEKFKKCRKCGGLDELLMTIGVTQEWFCADCGTERRVRDFDLDTPSSMAIDAMGE
jgi:hypothetical protein